MLMNVSIVAPPSCCFAMFNSFTLAFTFTDGVLHLHMPHPSIHCFVSVSVFCLRGAICIGRLLTLEVLLLHAVLKEQWKLLLCCYVCAVGLGSCVCTHSDKWWCPQSHLTELFLSISLSPFYTYYIRVYLEKDFFVNISNWRSSSSDFTSKAE